ncbi:hypothetical protein PTSG_04741 [Salpingoeca rosetta]|uniref:Cell cycle checkpoint protein RAD1 n=1 Tax=Salpingoeca rosetta (strain ATCC 50818 / BSB-021) TaxID=946362 RepID=F2U9K3_SALR5|nr:uncharacterized protein PTSG_04741 [Salpingoeca rosetta]EGD73030.1 hypothetical protein PTSG_04741 [Salpingoeca rosetta]|eukprot:XP_004994061.1 hypothetical protein PTSG_04741 [Salpingoeca rosetta]
MSMSMSMQSSVGESQAPMLLQARLEDAKLMTKLLKAIAFTHEATCTILGAGIKFACEQAKTVQARAFLHKDLFSDYRFTPEEEDMDVAEFKVNLSVLLECLSIFGQGDGVALRLSYAGYGSCLNLLLEEHGVVTDCSIRTQEADEFASIDMRTAAIPTNVIMKSDWLAEVFSELDTTSTVIEFYVAPTAPHFRLSTFGTAGTSQIDCPKTSDKVESFQCDKPLKFNYKLKLLKPSEKALALASQVSVRINEEGILSMQFLVETDVQSVFIEYLCLPDN